SQIDRNPQLVGDLADLHPRLLGDDLRDTGPKDIELIAHTLPLRRRRPVCLKEEPRQGILKLDVAPVLDAVEAAEIGWRLLFAHAGIEQQEVRAILTDGHPELESDVRVPVRDVEQAERRTVDHAADLLEKVQA